MNVARIRTIKPEFFKSATIAGLPLASRLTFIGMWCEADDDGRLPDDPVLLKAHLWPRDERTVKDVEADVAALLDAGLVHRLEVRERRSGKIKTVLQVTAWREHQTINKRTRGLYEELMANLSLLPEDYGSATGGLPELSGRTVGTEQGTGNREQGIEPSPAKAGSMYPNYGQVYAKAFHAAHGDVPPTQAIKRVARDAHALVAREGRDPEAIREAVVDAAQMGHANVSSALLALASGGGRGAGKSSGRGRPSTVDKFRDLAAQYAEQEGDRP